MDFGIPQIDRSDRDRGRAEVLDDLAAALNGHDPYTGAHSYRTASYSSGIARVLGYPSPALEIVRQAALVHDAGKIGVPRGILHKDGELTEGERTTLRLHPILGASVLSRIPGASPLIPIVMHHHERWDGAGYPHRLSGVDIPVESRIILVADAFDAMTSDRPYGRMLDPDEALSEIARCAGTQFDPLMVDALHEAIISGNLEPAPYRTVRIMDPEPHH